jgi:hypothetical protein
MISLRSRPAFDTIISMDGPHLIIRDSRTNLIVDYLPEVSTIAEVIR